jgi:ribulose-5-phosphate 4-epimerase/fuculose-1-phosphate aldolase
MLHAVSEGKRRRLADEAGMALDQPGMRPPTSEQEARHDLAALFRLADEFGWTDITSTHISARIPNSSEAFLMNGFDELYSEITASSICTVGFDGTMRTPGRPLNHAGYEIHSAVLNSRPEVNFVIHTHTHAAIAVGCSAEGLRPLSQHALPLLGTLARHAYQDSTAVGGEGEALVADLGRNMCCLLENHGLLVVGRTAAEAFAYHRYLEDACRIQVQILSCTSSPIEITPAAAESNIDWGRPENGPIGNTPWPALLRLLRRKAPDYAD